MRSAKEQDFFPYSAKTVCNILAMPDGNIRQIHHTLNEVAGAYNTALQGLGTLYAVWPGQYRSDLFIVDDLNAFADAFAIPREDDHIHEIEWEISSVDDGVSRYAYVDCRFRCGCSFWKMGLKKFALDMQKQKGWDVATSKGCGGHGDIFSMHVKRSSLK